MEEFDLKRFAKLAMAKKIFIIIIMIVSIVVGIFYSYTMVTPKYKAKTTLLLAQINTDKINQNTVEQSEITDLSMTSTLLEPYISIIESNKVLRKVINNLNLNMNEEQLKSMINVSEENTAMISIVVVSEEPEFCAKIANEVANVFTEESHEIFKITNVNIIDVAEVKATPYNVNHVKDILMFTILGGFISCGLILIIYILDTTIKEEEDIEQELKLPVLGVIPIYTKNYEKKAKNKKKKNSSDFNKNNTEKKNEELVILGNAKSPVSEAFRVLRTNLTFSPNTKTILVTSSRMSEGKSYITANLGAAIAKAGKKIIIIDADMRKGRQNKIFDLDNKNGLSNYLANCNEEKIDVNEITSYIKTTYVQNLHIITSGSRPSNPAELLTPLKIQGLLSVLSEIYDIVLLDGTPSNIIADSVAIAKFVDYTLLVTSHKSTKLEEAKRLIKNFEQVGGKIKGAVLNKYPLTKEEYSSSYYYNNENGIQKLDEHVSGEIKSVKSFLDEANLQENQFDFLNKSNINDNNEGQIGMPLDNSNSLIECKIQKIDDEISVIKNMLMKIAMNTNQVNSKDIDIIRYDIQNLKASLDEMKDSRKIDELKDEIETAKELTESLLKTQHENNEKVKKFIENYYRNKSKKFD